MNEELTNDEVEIDLVDLGYVLLDKWRYLLIDVYKRQGIYVRTAVNKK